LDRHGFQVARAQRSRPHAGGPTIGVRGEPVSGFKVRWRAERCWGYVSQWKKKVGETVKQRKPRRFLRRVRIEPEKYMDTCDGSFKEQKMQP